MHELMYIDLYSEKCGLSSGGFIVVEPLKDIEEVVLDSEGRYKLNAIKITTQYNRKFTFTSSVNKNVELQSLEKGTKALSSWNKLVNFYNTDQRKQFYSFVRRHGTVQDSIDKQLVFKYVYDTLKPYGGKMRMPKQFAQIFTTEFVEVYINPKVDMRGVFTGDDLYGLDLAERMVDQHRLFGNIRHNIK